MDIYYWPPPNGHKIIIFLEKAGLEFKIIPLNISKGEQFNPEFLKISPNNKMPAIVDKSPNIQPFILGLLSMKNKELNEFQGLKQWLEKIQQRPAVIRAYKRGE